MNDSSVERRSVPRTMHSVAYSGVPRTAHEWAALTKISHGGTAVSRDELRRLFVLGLVERQFGEVCLTSHGREMLSLHDRTPPDPSDRGLGADEHLPLFRDAKG